MSGASGRVGVLLVGVKGAVATTTLAGLLAARQRLVEPRGMLTESAIARGVALPALDDLVFGGWDIAPGRLGDAACAHGIVPRHVLDAVENDLAQIEVYPGLRNNTSDVVRRTAGAELAAGTLAEAAELLEAHIRAFRDSNAVERVVVVNVSSTEAAPAEGPAWETLHEFEAGLAAGDFRITAGQVYAYAALRSGCPFVNFTPSVTVEAPALRALAEREGLPYAGRDGKTGQTAVKATLATLFRARELRVRGWYSLNILGNRDGAVLADPAHAAAKLASKRAGLEACLGYTFPHEVRIDYHPPRGDRKEAWDVIDFDGWLDAPMSMRIDWQGEDSCLAAPLVLDLARLVAFAHARGERGPLAHLAFYFKEPSAPAPYELAEQYAALAAYLAEARGDGAQRVTVVGREAEKPA